MNAPTLRLAAGRRGADGLTRQQVADHQRGRILLAMAEAVAAKGYVAVTVADVISRAGVSRATFYEQFTDKQDCFLAAFDAASALIATSSPSRGGDIGHDRRFDAHVDAYLEALCAAPHFARVFLVDIASVGPAGIARRAAGQQRFAASIAELLGARTEADRFACEALVAAIAGLVTTRVAAGDIDGLRALRDPIVDLGRRLFPES